MRRWVGLLAVVSLALGAPAPAVAYRFSSSKLPPPRVAFGDGLSQALREGRLTEAQYALERALSLFALGAARSRFGHVTAPAARDATLILRDLAIRRAELIGQDRIAANRILARPDDGSPDWPDVKYAVPAMHECSINTCVHWVGSTEHAPPPEDADANGIPDWVESTLDVLEEVWAAEVTDYGFRPPKSDEASLNHGPDGRFDVYLADIGPALYGYCTTDDPNASSSNYEFWDVSAYCVFDNDFSQEEFGRIYGLEALQDTAAHEFFHAVQAAYDWWEDPWIVEGTAAWIEDEVYDEIDGYDYFYGSKNAFRHPKVPVDIGTAWYRYGAWFFWRFMSEYLASHAGSDPTVIREVWEWADGSQGGPNYYSLQAAEQVTSDHGASFRSAFADFGAVNAAPWSFYEEGADYPKVAIAKTFSITATRALASGAAKLDHLTTTYFELSPGRGVPRDARLTVSVDVPRYARGPEATLVVLLKSGKTLRVPFNLPGSSVRDVPFGKGAVAKVVLVLTNASTRMRCWNDTWLSCQGTPRDDGTRYSFSASLEQ